MNLTTSLPASKRNLNPLWQDRDTCARFVRAVRSDMSTCVLADMLDTTPSVVRLGWRTLKGRGFVMPPLREDV